LESETFNAFWPGEYKSEPIVTDRILPKVRRAINPIHRRRSGNICGGRKIKREAQEQTIVDERI
jgi:hypothetical protein